MSDVKRNPVRLTVIIIIAVSVLLLVLMWIAGFITGKGRSYTSYSAVARINRNSSSNVKYIRDGRYLAAYSSEGITAYDSLGNTVWSAGVSLEDPRAVCAGDFFAAADIGGRTFYVIDQSADPASPVEVDTLADILEISISRNGRAAVLMQEDSGYRIQIIDPYANSKIMAEIVTTAVDGFAMDIALSPDGTKLVTEYFKDDAGELTSDLTFYNFTSTGENAGADRIVGAFPYKGELFGELLFTDNDHIVCFGDSSVRAFSFSHEPALLWERTINGKIRFASADKTITGFVLSTNREIRAVAFSTDNGKNLFDRQVDFDVYGMSCANKEMLMYSSRRSRIIRADGTIKYDGETEDDLVFASGTNVHDKYFVVAGEHIDVIKLN